MEIVEAKGPIRDQRLAVLVARSFGVQCLRLALAKKIIYQAAHSGTTRDEHGLIWPGNVDRDAWEEFRPSPWFTWTN